MAGHEERRRARAPLFGRLSGRAYANERRVAAEGGAERRSRGAGCGRGRRRRRSARSRAAEDLPPGRPERHPPLDRLPPGGHALGRLPPPHRAAPDGARGAQRRLHPRVLHLLVHLDEPRRTPRRQAARRDRSATGTSSGSTGGTTSSSPSCSTPRASTRSPRTRTGTSATRGSSRASTAGRSSPISKWNNTTDENITSPRLEALAEKLLVRAQRADEALLRLVSLPRSARAVHAARGDRAVRHDRRATSTTPR